MAGRSCAPTRPVNTRFLFGAHHPHCPRHEGHLLWIAGRPICLGCACVTAGVALGATLAPLIHWNAAALPTWVAFHLALLVPTAAQPWFQRRPFKVFARTLLGFTSATYLASGLWLYSPPEHVLALRILTPIAFAVGVWALRSLRAMRPSNPCLDCPLGTFPFCSWNELEREAS